MDSDIRDISNEQEIVPISFRNDYNYDPLPPFVYTKELRIAENLYSYFEEAKGCHCLDICTETCSCVLASGSNTRIYESNGFMTDDFREFLKPDKLEIFYVNPKKGFGVRTLQPVKANQFVMEYTGDLALDEAHLNYDYGFSVDLDDIDYVVQTELHCNAARFINHSCDCNLYSAKVVWDTLRIPHICFYARRDIYKGEELTIDYGKPFWDVKLREFTCECGEAECQYKIPIIEENMQIS
uniref:SET domain-containing protein n=1 Tax=Acrobeloides nanus TaxID=290746 RepID=A0A914EH89_9BILA